MTTPLVGRRSILLAGASLAIDAGAASAESTARRHVIVFPAVMRPAAQALEQFRAEFEGVSSLLVSVEEIETGPAHKFPIPKFDGWAHRKPSGIRIRGYRYELATRIAAYLEALSRDQLIGSVLLLGNAALVPPSYYFFVRYTEEPDPNLLAYTSWIPSDIFYASGKPQLEMSWPIGRLPVDTNAEALRFVAKLRRWRSSWAPSWTSKAVYIGGNVTFDFRYLGEMYALALQRNGALGNQPLVLLESAGSFTTARARQVFAQEPAALLWVFGHGSGDGMGFADGVLRAREVAAMPFRSGLPLVLSPACLDAGFDYALIDVPFDQSDGLSLGAAIVKSEGAGIGYLGGARINLTGAEFSLDRGQLVFRKAGYMPALLSAFLDAYAAGVRRIGDAYLIAHNRFAGGEAIQGPADLAMYVNFVYLGDPALSLPARVAAPRVTPVSLGVARTTPFRLNNDGVPVYRSRTRSVELTLDAVQPPDAPVLVAIDALQLSTLASSTVSQTHAGWIFKPPRDSLYLLQATSPSGAASWLYLWVGEDRPLGSIQPKLSR